MPKMTGPHRYLKKADQKAGMILQMKVSLHESNPLIWRRVLVPANFTLIQFHEVLQSVMGWTNSHLFLFEIAGSEYGDHDDEGFEGDPELKRAGDFTLSDALGGADSFRYVYDFGDDWHHDVVIEKNFKWDENLSYPACIGGENACPPEDCGGIGGYYDLLEKLRNPEDEDHLRMKQWIGGYFDPSTFDPNRINRDHLWTIKWTSARSSSSS